MKNISSLQNTECKTQNTKCKKYLFSAGSWRQSCFWLQREQVLHTEAPARNQNGALVKTHPISLEIKIPVGRIPCLQVVIFLFGKVRGTNTLQVETWLGTKPNSQNSSVLSWSIKSKSMDYLVYKMYFFGQKLEGQREQKLQVETWLGTKPHPICLEV